MVFTNYALNYANLFKSLLRGNVKDNNVLLSILCIFALYFKDGVLRADLKAILNITLMPFMRLV